MIAVFACMFHPVLHRTGYQFHHDIDLYRMYSLVDFLHHRSSGSDHPEEKYPKMHRLFQKRRLILSSDYSDYHQRIYHLH